MLFGALLLVRVEGKYKQYDWNMRLICRPSKHELGSLLGVKGRMIRKSRNVLSVCWVASGCSQKIAMSGLGGRA